MLVSSLQHLSSIFIPQ
ncbi:hypothetical protein F383_20882 [Gossypium arboreum]|uniref:Uncharacterized protein n=1 Tax=Gossypium arboreum TaxID=29729 RepID=A0A0B0MFX7_GOSAR|nr:hypothetical protein F383_20882 [Gossypium arboreum]